MSFTIRTVDYTFELKTWVDERLGNIEIGMIEISINMQSRVNTTKYY